MNRDNKRLATVKTATNQAVYNNTNRDPSGRFIKGNKPKTSFADRPHHRSNGRWKKEDSISYQYKKFLQMSVKEFRNWYNVTDQKSRTMAMEVAYKTILLACSMRCNESLAATKEITTRTEGKAPVEPCVQDYLVFYEQIKDLSLDELKSITGI